MNEVLIIMEKYKEVLEKAKTLYNMLSDKGEKSHLEELFPELKELDDNKTWEELFEFIDKASGGYLNSAIPCEKFQEWGKWLVKGQFLNCDIVKYIRRERNKIGFHYQGKEVSWIEIPHDVRRRDYPSYFKGDLDCYPFEVEKNPFSGISFHYDGHVWGMCARDHGVDILCDSKPMNHITPEQEVSNESGDTNSPVGYGKFIDEKLNEPKFKVGNWYQCTKDFFGKGVTFDKNTAYYCAKEGCLQNEYGCHIAIVKDLYDNFKLWTIANARDGDILAADVIESHPSPFVAIYKRQDGELFETYCFIGHDGKFYKGEMGHASEYVHPATKEQCSALMKVMTDAGYTFDFEKKELKEIEQKSYGQRKECLDCQFNYAGECEGSCQMKREEQKPSWSEEDETYLDLINTAVKLYYTDDKGKENPWRNELLRWLESLKQRIGG